MDENLELSIRQIKGMPAKDLIKLSHEELEYYILLAEQASIDAAIVLNWLTYVKNEKAIAESNQNGFQGDKND